ncbi:MAG: recombination protein RecR [Bdellovibrionales bacterium]|nr:recombination protein RecR [Bdellovibrionales bacterium]
MNPLSKLVFELSKLPGIGEKTATRLAYFILNQDASYSDSLSQALRDAKAKLKLCAQCFNFAEANNEGSALCEICSDINRDQNQICVVERPSDVTPIERTGTYKGVYHVLHGLLSPLDGIGPEDIKLKEILVRLKTVDTREVIFALNPSVEGEATTLYLSRLLKPIGIKLSQVAYGIPFGGTIEFTDRQTLGKALENRVEMQGPK